MRHLSRLSLVLTLLSAALRAAEVAPGVELIPGRFVPGTQPDGNTVVFRGERGLIVIDTGRHPEHTQKILDFAEASRLPVAAIVNSHWHLDHVGGNARLKSRFPAARVYASSAIDDALKGFLARYRGQLEGMIETTPDEEKRKPWRAEIALIDSGRALAPDEVVTTSGARTLAGRKLDLELEARAVTAGDIWVFDEKTRVVAAGDLVTLPVPFLDTACPERWKTALDHVAKKDFKLVVPGHGAPMPRKAFERYRTAFGNLLSCGASAAPKDACVSGWIKDAGELIAGDDPKFVRSLMDYYVDVLRDGAQVAKLCGAP